MVGYSQIPATDPEEQRLRDEWYAAKQIGGEAFDIANGKLVHYIWIRACNTVQEDRIRHPKAKRNQPVPPRTPDTGAPGTNSDEFTLRRHLP